MRGKKEKKRMVLHWDLQPEVVAGNEEEDRMNSQLELEAGKKLAAKRLWSVEVLVNTYR